MSLSFAFQELKNKTPLSLALTKRSESTHEVSVFCKTDNSFEFVNLKYQSNEEAKFVVEELENRFSDASRMVRDTCTSDKIKRKRTVFVDHFDNISLYQKGKDRFQLIADLMLNDRPNSYNVFFSAKPKHFVDEFSLADIDVLSLN